MKYMKLCGISLYITVEMSEDGESWERRRLTGVQLLDVLASCFPAHYQEVREAATNRVTAELVFRVFGADYIFDRDYEPQIEIVDD